MILTGPPGTGKTTLARILGKALCHLGILSKGHFVEVDRSHLIAGYIGQTATKVHEVLDRARGGVLFIDEAYSLTGDPFCSEAIAALIKGTEDGRGDSIVILAGYPDKMNEFLDTNPGLRSRFPHRISFDHYDAKTLCQIFDLEIKNRDLLIHPDARKAAHARLAVHAAHTDESSGNGRLVRNFIESIERKLARRVATGTRTEEPTGDHDSTVTLADVLAATTAP